MLCVYIDSLAPTYNPITSLSSVTYNVPVTLSFTTQIGSLWTMDDTNHGSGAVDADVAYSIVGGRDASLVVLTNATTLQISNVGQSGPIWVVIRTTWASSGALLDTAFVVTEGFSFSFLYFPLTL